MLLEILYFEKYIKTPLHKNGALMVFAFYVDKSSLYKDQSPNQIFTERYKLAYKFDTSIRKEAEIELPVSKITCSAQSP